MGLLALPLAAAANTHFLNHKDLLSSVEDPTWFDANIPLIEVPSREIQQVYYFRWQSYREHLAYTSTQYGYMSTEFLAPTFYGAPYGGINAAAGFHIVEGRWLKDQRYGQDLVNYWLSGPGIFDKPADDGVNADTYDWVHEYSFWAGSAVWNQYLATGNKEFALGQLDNLVKYYKGWNNHFNDNLGLYWQVPVWDATEYTAASYETDNPYHGGAGYRPTLNAYQYGDAVAIAQLARLKGDTQLAQDFENKASALKTNMQKWLWDEGSQFFKHRQRDNNPDGKLLTTREIMGYIPWMFNMPDSKYISSFTQLMDKDGFSARYGPTTTEKRSKWYMHEAENGCCRWDGPSWPFATAQTLTAVENVLHDYPAQKYITSTDYVHLLQGYAETQYKNGSPYVAEAHYPDQDKWIYDQPRGEDYNHSTFVENVIAGLLGLRAQKGDSIVINPLTPKDWEYFAIENAPYHGHDVSVFWDATGNKYKQGKGFKVYVDGKLVVEKDTVQKVEVAVGAAKTPTVDTMVNIAANGQKFDQGTKPFASYTFAVDDPWRAIDGIVYRTNLPENTRWTSYNSPNQSDYFGIDMRRPQAVSDVRLFFYDDNGGVRIPSSYDLQYWTGSSWKTVPGQERKVGSTTSNAETFITFPKVQTSQLRVVAPNPGNGRGWGLSDFQVWTRPIYQLRNENSGKLMGVDHESTQNSAQIQQYEDNGTRDHLWEFLVQPGGWFKIRNLNSGLLLGVEGMKTSNSALLQQYEDNGTEDHLWRVKDKGQGKFVIFNKHSEKVAGVDRESTANSANVVQFEDNGTTDHLWTMLPAVPMS